MNHSGREDRQQVNEKKGNLISFLGGKSTLFVLVSILLIGLIIFVFKQIPFVFYPLSVLFSTVVLPVILAMIGYYLLRPVLRLLEKAKIPRMWGILILFLATAGVITLLIFLVVPFLKIQFHNLVDDFPTYFKKLTLTVDHFLRTSIFSSFYESLDINLASLVDNAPSNIGKTIADALGGIAVGVTSFVSALTGFVLAIVTVPFILFYLLKDGEKLPKVFINMLPPRMRDDARDIVKQTDHQISSYIQGQILVAICIGIMVSIGFFIIGMDYALLLGVLAMFTSVVPYLGPLIAITPAVIIAVVTSPFMIVKLAIVWTIVQLIDGKFISPQIMGKSLQIHPITIIFVLLTAGSLFGVAGVILGIPGFAVLKVFVQHFFRLYKLRYNRYMTDSGYQYKDVE
ncbi:AI-2E family transporter [Sporosarcina pasteurii]|uniref:Pheromone autoinducer 2 transporter n=1 Tax=Sporosarcina pasteurii TaxID=1474 RepID=A0A380BT88_SPOPA|nr:AI-2E family transporter [Sporosarcina pasteurii]MDS9471211.1 AI-2E family transporter [Sporosarcina pasteurii]QBQ05153.1 AI-2E family transporter [Sporosarcina pasteurii]SUJ05680.1 pheromone autoinducer 2 transporter [Sporosarcina pasteurii]